MAPTSISHLGTQIALLTKLKNDPNWVDGGPGQPGRPKFSKALTNYMLGTLLRQVSTKVSHRAIAAKLHNIGKELVTSAATGLVAGWEDGDDLCPPWPWPWPWPGTSKRDPEPDPWLSRLTIFDPQPEPWAEAWLEQASPGVQDLVMAQMALQIGSLAPDKQIAGQIQSAAGELRGGQHTG